MITNGSLHHILISEIIENGCVPDVDWLIDHFKSSREEVEKALFALQEYHGVVLHPNTSKIWVIHPFSTAPTNFYVKSSKGEWWGNCGWCSLGIAALIKTDVTITTSIGAEGSPQVIHIKDGRILEKNLFIHFPIPMKNAWDNVIYTCSNMLVFENEDQIDEWTERHNIPKGDIQPIQKIWEFSQEWYGNHLAEDWKKWTVKEAKEMFAKFGLAHEVWQLEESKGRF